MLSLVSLSTSQSYISHYSNMDDEAFIHLKSKEQFHQLLQPLDEYVEYSGRSNTSDHISRIFIVRHGQTLANEQGIIAGQSEYPISEKGIKEAKETGKTLSEKVDHFSAVYATSLTRTIDTIKAIANVWALKNDILPEPVILSELCERHFGTLERSTKKEFQPYVEKEISELSELKSFKDRFDYKKINDGQYESFAEVFNRSAPALARMGQNNLGKDVLVCAHGGVMHSLVLGLLASLQKPVTLGVRSFEIPNSAILVIEYDGKTNELNVKAADKITFLD